MQRIGQTAGSRGWPAFGVSDLDEGMRLILTQIIHEGIGVNLDRMTNGQFPMTKRAGSAAHTVTVSPNRRICHWSFAIGLWSFPQDSRAVFANNAG